MPELPEVEQYCRQCSRVALGKKIETVKTGSSRVLEVSESTLRRHLLRNNIESCSRHGKYLFLNINDGYVLSLHFGMSGYLDYIKEGLPEHTHLALLFSSGKKLAYISMRKFGRVSIAESIDSFVEKKGLGPDALEIGKDEFAERIGGYRGSIKGALMDQGLVAGLGNVYSDEILYQEGLLPGKKARHLDKSKLDKMYSAMKRILKTAIRHKGERKKFPDRYLAGRREVGTPCGICNGKIKKKTHLGRPTYFCPGHQK
ncbi:formamidopyrimidine-DNA glycosylase [Candidatus Micrarchaeota archaeon]|nr:formamidopyrimidine-DNA glycosylase [Candidatus Micrarchaeota archaeon]